jgi:hypothetical protein
MANGGPVRSGMGVIRTFARVRLATSLVALGMPLCAFEAASKAPTSGELTATKRPASVVSTVGS